jgi:hypothetical protein
MKRLRLRETQVEYRYPPSFPFPSLSLPSAGTVSGTTGRRRVGDAEGRKRETVVGEPTRASLLTETKTHAVQSDKLLPSSTLEANII